MVAEIAMPEQDDRWRTRAEQALEQGDPFAQRRRERDRLDKIIEGGFDQRVRYIKLLDGAGTYRPIDIANLPF